MLTNGTIACIVKHRPVSPLSRITRWLDKIGQKLRASDDCKPSIVNFSKVMGDTVEVEKEIIILWLNIVMTFRNEAQGRGCLTDAKMIGGHLLPPRKESDDQA